MVIFIEFWSDDVIPVDNCPNVWFAKYNTPLYLRTISSICVNDVSDCAENKGNSSMKQWYGDLASRSISALDKNACSRLVVSRQPRNFVVSSSNPPRLQIQLMP